MNLSQSIASSNDLDKNSCLFSLQNMTLYGCLCLTSKTLMELGTLKCSVPLCYIVGYKEGSMQNRYKV